MRRAHLASVPAVLALAMTGLTTSVVHADGTAGATLYVNKAGTCSDTAVGAGSQTLPYCTLQAAANAVQPGQTIQLVQSTTAVYNESVLLRNSGTAAAPITIDGAGDSLQAGAAAALSLTGVHDVVVRNIHVLATAGYDAVDVSGSQNVKLDQVNAAFSNAGTEPVDAFDIDGTSSSVVLSRSLVSGPWSGNQVHVRSGAQNVVITTNQLNGYGYPSVQPPVLIDGATNVDVTSNTVYAPGVVGISLTGADSAVIENNAVRSTTASSLSVSAAAAPHVQADYNTMQDSVANQPLYSWAGTVYTTAAAFNGATGQGAHDGVIGDPLVDSANSDAPGELSTDRLGNPRADDPFYSNTGAGTYKYYDRGALEVQDRIYFPAASTRNVAAGTSLDMQPVTAPTSYWGEALTVTVDFGDGTAPQSAAAGTTIPHVYQQVGQFVTTTTVANADGYTVSTHSAVNVLPATVEQPVLNAGPYRDSTGQHFSGDENYWITSTTGNWQYSNLTVDYGDGSLGSNVTSSHRYTQSGVYQVTLTGTDLLGRPVTAHTAAVVGLDYIPSQVGAVRVYDSRTKGLDSVPAHGTVRIPVTWANSNQEAAVYNLTVTDAKSAGFVTAYPDGSSQPTASNVNFGAGQTIANQATVRNGTDGYVDVYNGSSGPIDLVVDVFGSLETVATGTEYQPTAPTRIADTRQSGQQVPGHGSVTIQLPAALQAAPGPDTLELNVTATNERGEGWATVYTAGASRPGSSNLNWSTGVPAANLTTVTADSQGRVTLYNGSPYAADFVVDIAGLYQPQTTSGPLTGFVTTAPTRLLDTRNGTGAPAGQLQPGNQVKVCVPGPAGISAAALNLTVTGGTASGWLTAYPDGAVRPGTSSINWIAGQTVANMTQTQTGADGCVEIYNGSGKPVSVIADLSGYQYTYPQG
ncbi:hypothetical protein ABIA33_003685 [Streptacidiphilus sp. MAP12-16]|uniref:PKD domain-containing protein n=1 Tax=Streptacidiphilus sp. MAP12-16 TaxID=3156300 RepID=UPI0035123D9D